MGYYMCREPSRDWLQEGPQQSLAAFKTLGVTGSFGHNGAFQATRNFSANIFISVLVSIYITFLFPPSRIYHQSALIRHLEAVQFN